MTHSLSVACAEHLLAAPLDMTEQRVAPGGYDLVDILVMCAFLDGLAGDEAVLPDTENVPFTCKYNMENGMHIMSYHPS